MGNIKIPAYIVASYSSGIHSEGTLRGYEESQGPKWYARLDTHMSQASFDIGPGFVFMQRKNGMTTIPKHATTSFKHSSIATQRVLRTTGKQLLRFGHQFCVSMR